MSLPQDEYAPTLRETVAHQLLQLRTARTPNKRKTVAIALLPTLEKNPSLASQCFHVGGLFATPLYHYLRAGVDDVSTIQRLYKICSSLPQMHVACENCSAEIIEFLFSQQHPGSMLIKDDLGYYPFDYAMRNSKVSTAAKKKILGLCPEAVGSGYPLYHALSEEYPIDFLEYMVEIWPPTIDTADLGNLDGVELRSGYDEVTALNLAQARILCKLLPKLVKLSLGKVSWHYDSCTLFLKELQNNTTLVTLTCFRLPLMGTESEVRQQDLVKLFRTALQKNTTLRDVDDVVFVKECMRLTYRWALALGEMISCDHSLKFCHFVDGLLEESSGPLFSAVFLPRKPMLRFVGLDFADRAHVNHFHEISATTGFDAIQIDNSTDTEFKAVSGGSSTSMSMALVALFGTRHRFTKFGTHTSVLLDMPMLFESLRTNTQLLSLRISSPSMEKTRSPNAIAECLEMLEHHNTTLRILTPFCHDHPRIQYFLDLNRLGRKAIRDTTSIHAVLHLLIAAQQANTSLWQSQDTYSRLQSVLYGLLHESLGLWGSSTSQADRKRKHGAHETRS